MKYSIIAKAILALARAPGAIWCYLGHSWKGWEDVGYDRAFQFHCKACERQWHYTNTYDY